jgi:protein TonB
MRLRRAAVIDRREIAAGLAGSAIAHAGVVLSLVLAVGLRPVAAPPRVYSVELIAAPPAVRAPRAEARPPTPAPPPAPVVNPKKVTPKAPVVTKPKPPPKIDPKVEPATRPSPAPPPNPGVTPGSGTDVENVRVEGIQFPYPEYLRNIMNQILRRWARPVGAGALSAEVAFTIQRDGRVREIRVIRSSRNYTFDLEAQGAIEQAAADRAFGALPTGWPGDVLNVAFLFTPRPPS